MDVSLPILLLLLLLLWMVLVRVWEAVRNYPPSCIGVPLLGRVPMIAARVFRTPNSNFYREMTRDGISKGDVWSSFLGMRRVIGLTSYDAIFDALSRQGNDFAWRPSIPDYTRFRMINDTDTEGKQTGVAGIVESSGDPWRQQRRFAMSVMRDLGMGKNLTEEKIQIEARCLSEELKKEGGQAFCPSSILTRSVTNIISQFVFGYRAGSEDFECEQFTKWLKEMINDEGAAIFLPMMFPGMENSRITRYLSKGFNKLEQSLIDFIERKVNEVEAKMSEDSGSPPEHYVEAFLRRQKTESDASNFTRRQLIISVYDLFAAGSETTSTFLNWALIYLSVHRDWQEKLQLEIDEELDSQRDIAFVDRLRCHKTMAFIDEVQRHASIVPHNVMHAVGEECLFRGYRIPTDAVIIPDIYSVHFDPKLWPAPHTFDPNRFLKDSGEYQASKFLIPFSVGKRACMGESLARMEIFIFLASIVRDFEVDIDDQAKALKDEVFIGADMDIHQPKAHKVILTSRKE